MILTTGQDSVLHTWDTAGKSVGEPIIGYENCKVSFIPGDRYIGVADGGLDNLTPFELYDRQGRSLGERRIGDVLATVDLDGEVFVASPDWYTVPPTGEVLRVEQFDLPTRMSGVEETELLLERCASRPEIRLGAARTIRFEPSVNGVVVSLAGMADVMLPHRHPVTAFALTVDGSEAVTATDRFLHFWDAGSGRELAVLSAEENVSGLRFTADGSRLLIALASGLTETWDSRTAADRQRERDALFAESPAARAYVQALVDKGVPDAALLDTVMADKSLSPFRRSEAFEWAVAHLRASKPPTTSPTVPTRGPSTRPTTGPTAGGQ